VSLSEFDIIARFFTHPAAAARLGVGDDAALVRVRRGKELAVSADMLVSGRHFFRDADPRALGYKALAVNLSDMAAMGATPRWATLSLALPKADPAWLRAFSSGFMRLAREYRVDLIGGDTTGGALAICVQILGEVPAGHALTRGGAQVGDDVWVSGTLGDAALAVAALRKRIALAPQELARVRKQLDLPAPRVVLGVALRGVATSAIDISDGLIADLGHICERSNVSAVVEFGRLPASPILRRYLDRAVARSALLAGGDDYELCFTAPRSRRGRIERIGRRIGVRLTRIGEIAPPRDRSSPVSVLGEGGKPIALARRGFDHFA
jgi:thiamine-monophosphate kinase